MSNYKDYKLLDELRPRRISSWADEVDSYGEDLFDKDELSFEEFSRCLDVLVKRCQLDLNSNKTSHHFQVDDTFIDLMLLRNHMIISVSSRQRCNDYSDHDEEEEENEDHDTSESDQSRTESDIEESGTLELEQKSAAKARFLASASKPWNSEVKKKNISHVPESENVFAVLELKDDKNLDEKKEIKESAVVTGTTDASLEDNTWTTVVKKSTLRRVTHEHKQKKNFQKTADWKFFFFSDEANNRHIEYEKTIVGLEELIKEAKKHKWCHGYCMDENVVYDFPNPEKPGEYRRFYPNLSYLHKFNHWYESDRSEPDTRIFYVFRENSKWTNWQFMNMIIGLKEVRAFVKASNVQWAHAYNAHHNELINFCTKDGRFIQKVSLAPEKYLDRFEIFLKEHPELQSEPTCENTV